MIACSMCNMTVIKHLTECNVACPTIESLLCAADNKAEFTILKYLASKVSNGNYNPMESYDEYRVRLYEVNRCATGSMVHECGLTLTVFLHTLDMNHFDLMRALVNVSNVINMDSEGNTPLHLACTWENSW